MTSSNRSLTSSIAAKPSTENLAGCVGEGFAVLGDGEVDRVLSSSAAPTRRSSELWGSASGTARRHCPIPVMPLNAGCDIGPLMMGACAGSDRGAGIRF